MSNRENKISPKEALLIQNIINKVTTYMDKNNQTLFNLAQTTGFAYQPLHRLMKGMSVPSLSSLAMLSDYLNCSISELINDEFFLDVDVINNINELPQYKSTKQARIYIPFHEFTPHLHKKFIVVVDPDDNTMNRVFYLTNEIIGDGEFIVIYKKKYVVFNVILSSSKFVLIENKGREEKIATSELQVLGKLFKYSVICNHNKNQINSKIIAENPNHA